MLNGKVKVSQIDKRKSLKDELCQIRRSLKNIKSRHVIVNLHDELVDFDRMIEDFDNLTDDVLNDNLLTPYMSLQGKFISKGIDRGIKNVVQKIETLRCTLVPKEEKNNSSSRVEDNLSDEESFINHKKKRHIEDFDHTNHKLFKPLLGTPRKVHFADEAIIQTQVTEKKSQKRVKPRTQMFRNINVVEFNGKIIKCTDKYFRYVIKQLEERRIKIEKNTREIERNPTNLSLKIETDRLKVEFKDKIRMIEEDTLPDSIEHRDIIKNNFKEQELQKYLPEDTSKTLMIPVMI